MALNIFYKKGTYLLKGQMNETTSSSFLKHFSYLMSIEEGLTIDIKKIKKIDNNGKQALKTLYEKAIDKNLRLKILGIDHTITSHQ